jgi:hypothetical protein
LTQALPTNSGVYNVGYLNKIYKDIKCLTLILLILKDKCIDSNGGTTLP